MSDEHAGETWGERRDRLVAEARAHAATFQRVVDLLDGPARDELQAIADGLLAQADELEAMNASPSLETIQQIVRTIKLQYRTGITQGKRES
jgi:hypothetical protein